MCIGIEKNILEKINTGISLLKINSYIDCIIKKIKKMYSLDFVGFKLEFDKLSELISYCKNSFYDPFEYVTKDGKNIGIRIGELYER